MVVATINVATMIRQFISRKFVSKMLSFGFFFPERIDLYSTVHFFIIHFLKASPKIINHLVKGLCALKISVHLQQQMVAIQIIPPRLLARIKLDICSFSTTVCFKLVALDLLSPSSQLISNTFQLMCIPSTVEVQKILQGQGPVVGR